MNNQLKNKTRNVVPQCKVVVYNWAFSDFEVRPEDNNTLGDTIPLDISSQIRNCTFQKDNGQPSGSFSITLANSTGPNSVGSNRVGQKAKGDWKNIIKRGSWLVIYMSNEGDLTLNGTVGAPYQSNSENSKIRCIGYIDRVSVTSEIDDNGAFDIQYNISGRDFGVVYEDTSIWHNIFKFDETLLNTVEDAGFNIQGVVKVHDALKLIHDLFFYPANIPGARVNDQNSLTSIALQWIMPRRLVEDIGLNTKLTFVGEGPEPIQRNTYYWGGLAQAQSFSPTDATVAVNSPSSFLSGDPWSHLKRISVPELHELYTEISPKGIPQIIFRPIPFSINKDKYLNVGKKITLYKDLSRINLTSLDVINFNVGEDNYSRYNSFLTTIQTSIINDEDTVSILGGTRFPLQDQSSIKRHGFRPMHPSVNGLLTVAEKSNSKVADRNLLIEFNEVIRDYWENAVYSESGVVNIIGSNEIRIGFGLTFEADVPYVTGKLYYIEGYSDTFSIEDNGAAMWTQEVSLTRGFEIADLEKKDVKQDFDDRSTDFDNEGEYTEANSTKIGKK